MQYYLTLAKRKGETAYIPLCFTTDATPTVDHGRYEDFKTFQITEDFTQIMKGHLQQR